MIWDVHLIGLGGVKVAPWLHRGKVCRVSRRVAAGPDHNVPGVALSGLRNLGSTLSMKAVSPESVPEADVVSGPVDGDPLKRYSVSSIPVTERFSSFIPCMFQ